MGKFTIVSDVSKTIRELLHVNCVPTPIASTELIGICSPDDLGGFSVGIHLYDIEENTDMRSRQDIVIDTESVRQAPSCLNLYYVIFISLKSDPAIRAVDEQLIIGKIHQTLSDNRIVDYKYLQGTLAENNEKLGISLLNMPYEEKLKIWSAFNIPPKTCLFYKTSPIYIESENIKKVRRVVEADIDLKRKDGKR